jgi:hypothetical protein
MAFVSPSSAENLRRRFKSVQDYEGHETDRVLLLSLGKYWNWIDMWVILKSLEMCATKLSMMLHVNTAIINSLEGKPVRTNHYTIKTYRVLDV